MIKIEDIVPLKNFVLIKAHNGPAQSASGLIMPEERYVPTPVVGKVISAGPQSQFKIGEYVFFRRYSVDELKFKTEEGEEVVSLLSDDEIVATIPAEAADDISGSAGV